MVRTALGAGAALLLLASVAPAASAGEATGSGKPITVNAKSDCAYSGLEDWNSPAPQPDGEVDVVPGVVQNWGVIPKQERDFLRSIGVSPNTLCNGRLNPIK